MLDRVVGVDSQVGAYWGCLGSRLFRYQNLAPCYGFG